MPELPDVTVYVERARGRVVGPAARARPHRQPVPAAHGRRRRSRPLEGKRVVRRARGSASASCIALEDELFLVIHLMIAGRLRWLRARREAARQDRRSPRFDFATGTLVLTEAGTKRRASLHVVRGEAALARARPRRARGARRDARRRSPRALRAREPHAQARAHRSARSSAASATPTPTRSCTARGCRRSQLTAQARRRRDRAAATRRRATMLAEWTERLRARGRRRVSREGHRVPPGDGGARPLRPAVPGLRHAGAAHRLRRERDATTARCQTGGAARRPRAVAAAAQRLAARGVTSAPTPAKAWCQRSDARAGVLPTLRKLWTTNGPTWPGLPLVACRLPCARRLGGWCVSCSKRSSIGSLAHRRNSHPAPASAAQPHLFEGHVPSTPLLTLELPRLRHVRSRSWCSSRCWWCSFRAPRSCSSTRRTPTTRAASSTRNSPPASAHSSARSSTVARCLPNTHSRSRRREAVSRCGGRRRRRRAHADGQTTRHTDSRRPVAGRCVRRPDMATRLADGAVESMFAHPNLLVKARQRDGVAMGITLTRRTAVPTGRRSREDAHARRVDRRRLPDRRRAGPRPRVADGARRLVRGARNHRHVDGSGIDVVASQPRRARPARHRQCSRQSDDIHARGREFQDRIVALDAIGGSRPSRCCNGRWATRSPASNTCKRC